MKMNLDIRWIVAVIFVLGVLLGYYFGRYHAEYRRNKRYERRQAIINTSTRRVNDRMTWNRNHEEPQRPKGTITYYYGGKKYTEEEFNDLIKELNKDDQV